MKCDHCMETTARGTFQSVCVRMESPLGNYYLCPICYHIWPIDPKHDIEPCAKCGCTEFDKKYWHNEPVVACAYCCWIVGD